MRADGRTYWPGTPVISALTWLAALGTFLALVVSWSSRPPTVDALVAASDSAAPHYPATAALERRWIESALDERFLLRPVADGPCVDDIVMDADLRAALDGALAVDSVEQLSHVHQRFDESWLPGVLLGQRLLRRGDSARALDVLADVYRRPRVRSLIERVVASARRGDPRRAPSTAETLAMIHLLHAYGVAQIETRQTVELDYWRALKNPIGAVRVLAARGVTGTVVDAPTHDEHRLPPPGCPPAVAHDVAANANGLTSLDLYNNLIVGYLRAGSFVESAARRNAELRRAYEDDVDDNPLQHALSAAVDTATADDEHWVWALSNAERLLRERRLSSSGALTNPRLALNLAQLVAQVEARGLAPTAADALRRERQRLTAVARDHRTRVDAAQRPVFDAALARLILLDAIETGTRTSVPGDVLGHLEPAPRAAAGAVIAADGLRHDARRRAEVVTGRAEDDPLAPLPADERAAWRAALRSDLTGLIATAALGQDGEARSAAARTGRRLMVAGDPPSAAYRALRDQLGVVDRLHLAWAGWRGFGRWLLAALAAALVWSMGRWWGIQWRRRNALFTSFYRREAQARLGR